MKKMKSLPPLNDPRMILEAGLAVRVHGEEVDVHLDWLSDRIHDGSVYFEDDVVETAWLDLSGKGIERLADVEGLDELPRLDAIRLRGNKLRSLDELAGMPWAAGLKMLDVAGNPLERLDGLAAACKALERLEISGGLWQDAPAPALDRLDHLVQLRLTEAASMRGIGHLPALVELLAFENCSIQRIEGLDRLPNLKNLSLARNKIERIVGLEHLARLETLGLDDNQISRIEGLDQLDQLKSLGLSNNHITKIEGLDRLDQLKSLGLSNNHITKIEGLDALTKLEKVDLSGNPIPGVDRMREISESHTYSVEEILDFSKARANYIRQLKQSGIEIPEKLLERMGTVVSHGNGAALNIDFYQIGLPPPPSPTRRKNA